MNAAAAIDRRAIAMVRRRRGPGDYDDGGTYIEGLPVSAPIKAVIQPASGDQLKDVPEGLRTEANWIVWTRTDLELDDVIDASNVSYRVVYVWPRAEAGFYRAALGRISP